jgi:hypothetical protein
MVIHGGICVGSNLVILSSAFRLTATRIDLRGVVPGAGATNAGCSDGDTSTFSISISW